MATARDSGTLIDQQKEKRDFDNSIEYFMKNIYYNLHNN
jgi:hypothetical protein